MRKETIGDAVLFHGDCQEILAEVGAIDLVLSDPPYGIDYQSSWRIDKSARLPKIANDKNLDFMPSVMASLYEMCPENSHAYVFCRWDKWPLNVGPWNTTNMIVWDKMQHGTGDLENSYGPQHELIAFLTKGRRGFRSKRPVDVMRCQKVAPEKLVHSCEKPIALLEVLISASSLPTEVVCDPFMGSGSTGIAAVRSGRKFVGIEIDLKYFDLSCRRIEAAIKQPSLFVA